jgi:hypothetical protein
LTLYRKLIDSADSLLSLSLSLSIYIYIDFSNGQKLVIIRKKTTDSGHHGAISFPESRAIARYVLRKHKPELLRDGDLQGSALVDQWMDVEAHNVEPTLWPIIRHCIIGQYVGRARDQGVIDENLSASWGRCSRCEAEGQHVPGQRRHHRRGPLPLGLHPLLHGHGVRRRGGRVPARQGLVGRASGEAVGAEGHGRHATGLRVRERQHTVGNVCATSCAAPELILVHFNFQPAK